MLRAQHTNLVAELKSPRRCKLSVLEGILASQNKKGVKCTPSATK